MTAGRPYDNREALVTAAQDTLALLDWPAIRVALAAHPRIGAQTDGGGREAGWSRQEQHGTSDADDATLTALYAANLAYEERFGHVFLICATGLSATDMLVVAQERLGNDPGTERRVVRAELGRIVTLRLDKLLTGKA